MEQLIAGTAMTLIGVGAILWVAWMARSHWLGEQAHQKRKFMHELKYGDGNPPTFDIR